jgi:hypothetical protein
MDRIPYCETTKAILSPCMFDIDGKCFCQECLLPRMVENGDEN